MILRPSTRKLETGLVSYSRPNLPRRYRSFRPYATAALAHASTASESYRSSSDITTLSTDMNKFLRRRLPYTVLPTPLPDDRSSPLNDYYFTDSSTQDSLAIIDACLHNLYDVPRAQQVFQRLRDTKQGGSILEPKLYNSFIEAYIEMATTKESDNRDIWVEDAWHLFEIMDNGREKVSPTASTYALMLLAWIRFNPESPTRVSSVTHHDVPSLLSGMIDRGISMTSVISDRTFTSSTEASQAITALSKAAVRMGLSRVVSELGEAEAIGSGMPGSSDDVPEVRPVLRSPMKSKDGEGGDGATETELRSSVDEIPFNLDTLRKHLAQVILARRVLPEDVAIRQKLLEESVYDVAVERLRHQAEVFEDLGLGDKGLKQPDLQKWMWDWHTKLKERIEIEIVKVTAHEETLKPYPKKKLMRISPFLTLVKPEKLSLVTILEVMRLNGSGGVADGMKTARALLTVGRAVENEYKAQMCRKNNIQIPNHARQGDNGFFSPLGYRDLHARRITARKYMEDAEEWTADWTQLLRVRIGSILVECLMDVARVTRTMVDKVSGKEISEEQPAFFHSYEYVRGQKLGVIRLNPVVADRLAKDGLREALHPRHLPMLVKPKPWLSHDQGGYLFNKTSAMRFKDSQEQQSYLRHASSLGNVELVYAGLDVLGSTPWKINRDIFNVVLEVWNSGGRLCKIPPAVYDIPEPEKPANHDTDQKVRSVYLQRQKAYAQSKANNHSERCNINYKIEIARAFLGDALYLPHNLDFRGRAYPIPPHLNHIGDDLSRGLLLFGEKKPLGVSGLRWLKIHLANLYGYDKGTFDERVNFVMDHIKDIYDSAENPLTGGRWWVKADDPWQCLACCMELRAALELPDPHEYLSDLPVHQDGTCNGLQHYAALGGDDQGARQVNLSVTDRPSDVYTYVAEMVEASLVEDMKKGEKYAQMLHGKIARKVVKQTVMTTVYGVTFVGAREQIERQLKDRKEIDEEECWPASSYLAKKVLACIGDLFSGAKNIQTWLNLCARLISKSIPADRLPDVVQPAEQHGQKTQRSVGGSRLRKEQMTSVVWTTPLGLPIVQPYRKTKKRQVMTSLQTVFISDPTSPAEVNSVKQASAFPPNFIHSLDATHMMLTALECRSQGLTFASVHDSYWTHACSIDKMSEVIRDTFIALHSSDVLGKLESEFKERYKDHKVPLGTLRTGQLLKQLAQAGTRLKAPSSEAGRFADVEALFEVSDTDQSSITEVHSPILGLSPEDHKVTQDDIAIVLPDRRRKKRPVPEADVEAAADELQEDTPHPALLGKFVDLVDLLPPLPKKGSFDVETIKGSQYFFS